MDTQTTTTDSTASGSTFHHMCRVGGAEILFAKLITNENTDALRSHAGGAQRLNRG